MRDRLIELIRKSNCVETWDYYNDEPMSPCPIEQLANYLLENGVIVPLCKVGDIVYTNYNHLLKKNTDEIFECKVVFIGFYEDGNYINLVDNYEHLHSMDFETFRKTVFHTKEEIEQV